MLLDRIRAAKIAEVRSIPDYDPSLYKTSVLSLYSALRRRSGEKLHIIAECKRASPSGGQLRQYYDVAEIARTYADLGASAVSVLTDREFFHGDPSHLLLARPAGLPVIRKDFIISPAQIFEARALGADAVLLIVRMLEDSQLRDFMSTASSLLMECLVEVHNEEEMRRALAAGANIIGINHRDLDTLQMDLSLSSKLAPIIRSMNPHAVIVAESGVENIQGRLQMDRFADAVLIGSAFMKSDDIPAKWKELFGH